jgi:hypothetical protein
MGPSDAQPNENGWRCRKPAEVKCLGEYARLFDRLFNADPARKGADGHLLSQGRLRHQ